MPLRIKIDQEKCIGCGQCANTCPHSAIEMVNGKARVTNQQACDGLGACLGDCPSGALELMDCPDSTAPQPQPSACPGTHSFVPQKAPQSLDAPAALENWPVQLSLINPSSALFHQAHLLLAADCTAFAVSDFQQQFAANRKVVIACPKLDSKTGYHDKLVTLLGDQKPASLTILRMEVPCCRGLVALVMTAAEAAGYRGAVQEIVVGVDGRLKTITPLIISTNKSDFDQTKGEVNDEHVLLSV